MSMFTTFYSYKGGVGRTLALANVAWILANDRSEPARVLVVDFDLAAPGLHRVFKMPRRTTSLGVTDFVLQYLASAQVPDVKEFIHKTSYPKIDIIPAGRIDKNYQRRLEGINWSAIYEGAHGYQLIEAFKKSINELSTDYDYVLIDSLTGFSDVGGICVKQMPDSLVLLFRLNQQNLDGIKTVYDSAGEDSDLPITPVVTPAWPFIDASAEVWLKKTREIFGKRRLHEISFDSGLSFGERIISSSYGESSLSPKVIVDYRRLANHIRAQNPADPLTIWRSLSDSFAAGTPEAAADAHLRLLKKRPHSAKYWEMLENTLRRARRRHKPEITGANAASARLRAFINEQAAKENKFALYGRANLTFSLSPDKEAEAINDLTNALRIDPRFREARLLRARVYLQQDEFELAVKDFTVGLELFSSKDPRRAVVTAELGIAYLEKFRASEAIKYLEAAISQGEPVPRLVLANAQALYLNGDYDQALKQTQRYLTLNPEYELARLLPSQILAAMGKSEEALQLLVKEEKQLRKSGDPSNLAEAYLAVSPEKSLELLKNQTAKLDSATKRMLKMLAAIFLGKPTNNRVAATRLPADSTWEAFEVVAMIRAKQRNASLSADAATYALQIVREATGAEIPD